MSLATAHLFSWAFIWGGSGYYSYVASPIAFKNLSRPEFGKLQNKIFPHFFLGQTVAPILIGLTAPYSLTTGALITLGVAVIGGATNFFYLLPVCKDLKDQRFELEESGLTESDQHKEITKKFGLYHTASLAFNAINFVALTTYGFILTKNLVRYIPK